MRREILLLLIVSALMLSFIFAILLHDLILSFIPVFLLFPLKKRYALPIGFTIGFLSFFAIYFVYPFDFVIRISNILGGIIGISGTIILILYPLLAAIIAGFGALLWSSIYTFLTNAPPYQDHKAIE
ncbi:MAG: hypothetical protein ACYDAO_10175 [Thermoplasmataceae archaeon]